MNLFKIALYANIFSETIEKNNNYIKRDEELYKYNNLLEKSDDPEQNKHFPDFCDHCKAKTFCEEANTRGNFGTLCCCDGAVKINPIQKYPESLQALWNKNSPKSKVIF